MMIRTRSEEGKEQQHVTGKKERPAGEMNKCSFTCMCVCL